jgi:hypothetical protein
MDDKDELPPAEAARERRRDRDAEARSRAGMRTGLAKQFKQVLDAQRKRAEDVGPRQKEPATEAETEARPKGRRRAQ